MGKHWVRGDSAYYVHVYGGIPSGHLRGSGRIAAICEAKTHRPTVGIFLYCALMGSLQHFISNQCRLCGYAVLYVQRSVSYK